MNIPNLITSLRFILTPLFVICLINGEMTWAVVVFVAAGITDGLDGLIARVFKLKTTLGAWLDPIADKILLTSAFITLAVLGQVPKWLAVLVVSRDVAIFVGVLTLRLLGFVFAIIPSLLSKVTTLSQLAAVFVVLARDLLPGLYEFRFYFFLSTALLTVGSGLHYIYLGLDVFSRPEREMNGRP